MLPLTNIPTQQPSKMGTSQDMGGGWGILFLICLNGLEWVSRIIETLRKTLVWDGLKWESPEAWQGPFTSPVLRTLEEKLIMDLQTPRDMQRF